MPFNLEHAIAAWRRVHETNAVFSAEDIRELEAHLREDVRVRVAEGATTEQAFRAAIAELGAYGLAEDEYRKVYWQKRRRPDQFLDALNLRTAMLANYLKIALRNVRRHKLYAALNVFGLAIGIACCLLIGLYVQDEWRYDRHHADLDRVYRLLTGTNGGGQPTNANGSVAAGPTLAQDFPGEIAYVARLRKMGWSEKRVAVYQDRRFAEAQFALADSTVFDVLTMPLLAGDPATALTRPGSIVLTEAVARKYFGDANPMGQTMQVDAYNDGTFMDFVVTGIRAETDAKTHVPFDILASWDSQVRWVTGWGFEPVYTYLKLTPGADANALEAQFPEFIRTHRGEDWWYSLHLQPITDVRLHSTFYAESSPTSSIAYIYLFGAIAGFILLLACINFMNLTTAQATQRAREVGVRKVVGAHRGQLAVQFLGEALTMSTLAALLALALTWLALPLFNDLADKALSLSSLNAALVLGGALGLALVVGFFSGSYPALVLTRFAPAQVLKGTLLRGRTRRSRLRESLVVFQFTISIGLLVCTLVVFNQMNHMRSINLGFEKEQVVVLPLNGEVRAAYETMQAALASNPRVTKLTMSEQVPGRAGNGSCYRVDGDETCISRLITHYDFATTYDIPMLAGRDFSRDFADQEGYAFMVNRAFIETQGWSGPAEALGKHVDVLGWEEYGGPIVGVTDDFQLFSLRSGSEPVMMMLMRPNIHNFLSIRIAPTEVAQTLGEIETVWTQFAPSYPFEYYFLDDDFERLHAADQRLGQVVGTFAGLAILVACLGLFGLAAFATARRTKEVGIRKVMGASASSLLILLGRDFARLVVVAFVVAAPLAWWAMDTWLDTFAYQTSIGLTTFALAGGLALVIALLTVSYQAWHAVRANPIETLRYE